MAEEIKKIKEKGNVGLPLTSTPFLIAFLIVKGYFLLRLQGLTIYSSKNKNQVSIMKGVLKYKSILAIFQFDFSKNICLLC